MKKQRQSLNQKNLIEATFIVCLPIRKRLTFLIPEEISHKATQGAWAVLNVGGKRCTGVLIERTEKSKETRGKSQIKTIDGFIESEPIPAEMLSFIVEMSRYYHYPEGLTLRLVQGSEAPEAKKVRYISTPSGLKMAQEGNLTEIEKRVISLLKKSPKTIRQLTRFIPILTHDKILEMMEKSLVEEIKSLPPPSRVSPEKLQIILTKEGQKSLSNANLTSRQRDIIRALSTAEGILTAGGLKKSLPVTLKELRNLEKQGIIKIKKIESEKIYKRTLSISEAEKPAEKLELTNEQKGCFSALASALVKEKFQVFLLHGVTGSGKTEVYLRIIQQALKCGKSSIVIVPEIALTPQLLSTFKRTMKDEIAVIHSGLNPVKRRFEMKDIARGYKRIVIGARSALFSPVSNPAVFVVDEEHDPSLKQGEGVRYHARDMAILRAKFSNAIVILSSATPSIESFYNALKGKYKLLTLSHRTTKKPLPEVEIVDLKKHPRGPHGQIYISTPLYNAIRETLASGGQVIIFLNRRGYAPVSICKRCGWTQKCPECSISLTYHKFTNRLSCHHCGFSMVPQKDCPECPSANSMEIKGPGTERIEEIIRGLFPSATVVRMDSDVASGAASELILNKLRSGQADILIGTQMITKGHDLPQVALVGVVRADAELNFPDFRASERTFSVLTQVAGRAGRGKHPGRVIFQTYNPYHPAIEAASMQNYSIFYQWEIKNRKMLLYPPFSHLALMRIEGANQDNVIKVSENAKKIMNASAYRSSERIEILGPAPSPIARIKKKWRYQILVKSKSRKVLGQLVEEVLNARALKSAGVRFFFDIDPVDFM